MYDIENLNAYLRHCQREVKALEATKAELSHNLSDLRSHMAQQSEFQSTIASLPGARQERDSLLSTLSTLSNQRLSDPASDICGHYCQYLISRVRDEEARSESLEAIYIDAKYGESSTRPSCNVPFAIPDSGGSLLDSYSQLKDELSRAESAFALTQSACVTLRHSLDGLRARLAEAAQSIPARVSSLEGQYESIADELAVLGQQLEPERERVSARRRRFEGRHLLIASMAGALSNLGLPDSLAQQAMHEVRELLLLINRPDAPARLVEAHVRALVGIARQPPEGLPKTPDARRSPLLPNPTTPEQVRSGANQIRAMLGMLATGQRRVLGE
jgi:DNA repair exonuclease SbcCD ATPase subunit